MRYAVGIVQHALTHRWQPWLYTEDATTQHLACLSSHASKAQAHLVAHIVLDAYQTHAMGDLPRMFAQSQEITSPDPLPQSQIEALMALIASTSPQTTVQRILEI